MAATRPRSRLAVAWGFLLGTSCAFCPSSSRLPIRRNSNFVPSVLSPKADLRSASTSCHRPRPLFAASGDSKDKANSEAAKGAEAVEVEVVQASELKKNKGAMSSIFEASTSTSKTSSTNEGGQAADKTEEKPENPFMKMFKVMECK